jgi:hypothetical protein
VVVAHRPRIVRDSGIFQKAAQAVEEVLFIRIVPEVPLAVDPPCDHMVQGAGCVDPSVARHTFPISKANTDIKVKRVERPLSPSTIPRKIRGNG